MFERRLRIFLVFLAAMTAVLIARAVQVQLIQHAFWVGEATTSMQHFTLTETTRGKLLDCKGRLLAEDEPSTDASVDYRAIVDVPDPQWLRDLAINRIKARSDKNDRVHRADIVQEVQQVRADIDEMWKLLAQQGDMSDDEMNDLRHTIVKRVELRRRHLWYQKQKRQGTLIPATVKGVGTPSTAPSDDAVNDWLNGDTALCPFDGFDIRVAEQEQTHVILRAIDRETTNRLGKLTERMPFLVLTARMERHYPCETSACHVIGQLQPVEAGEMTDDTDGSNPLKAYHSTDLIGRGGLEELCEPLLRGTRGRIEDSTDSNGVSTEHHEDPQPGADVACTIDIELQRAIEQSFDHQNVKPTDDDPDEFADLHGAAVVIDVASGDVRAMVSVPDFDLNTYDAHYSALLRDDLNQPLRNRATLSILETGSIIKPVVGIGAITSGVMTVNDTVTCDGYFHYNGKPEPHFRCWTMSEFEMPGHIIPYEDPHPTGKLTFSDALQRSCNVFFETMGDRLDVDGLAHWMRTFGLGRITGVGISEARGRLPGFQSEKLTGYARRNFSWGDAIGQKEVAATPLQMANVAATIARNGQWMRPRLVDDSITSQLRATASTHPTEEKASAFDWKTVPDQEDLHLNPAAVTAAQDGMWRVVNTIAGTGKALFHTNLNVSGKTGTAQASPFSVKVRDADGKEVMDGIKPLTEAVAPSTPQNINKRAPWYLGFLFTDKHNKVTIQLQHSWFIGFFPSQHPKLAFAVLVEYGGSGGRAAGSIANKMIDSCIRLGYVSPDAQTHELVP